MALNATEFHLISATVHKLRDRTPVRVICLGYPDLLADRGGWTAPDVAWEDLPMRDDAAQIWAQHGLAHLSGECMPETKATFAKFGADAKICDATAWCAEDFVLDLNRPLPRRHRGRFDIVIDPGTLEHCFNIAQAFANVDLLLRPGGFVYHQAAMAFPNHGFWSISPTAFFDFYQSLGYELGRPYRSAGRSSFSIFVPRYVAIDPFAAVFPPGGLPMTGSYLFRKRDDYVAPRQAHASSLIQRCYSALARDPPMTDFHAEFLGPDHPSLAEAREAA